MLIGCFELVVQPDLQPPLPDFLPYRSAKTCDSQISTGIERNLFMVCKKLCTRWRSVFRERRKTHFGNSVDTNRGMNQATDLYFAFQSRPHRRA